MTSIEPKLKHLELCQSVINRMASNSFLLKGWSITLISAMFALAAKDSNQFFIYLSYFPCLIFWSLDGYFLRKERMYRKLYQNITVTPIDKIDFNLNASLYSDQVKSWRSTCFSVTLKMFHGTIFGVIVLLMLLIILKGALQNG